MSKMIVFGVLGVSLLLVLGFGGVQAMSANPNWVGTLMCITGSTSEAAPVAALDPDRADCPGLITCPITGEPVCKDRCPEIAAAASIQIDLPACCSIASH